MQTLPGPNLTGCIALGGAGFSLTDEPDAEAAIRVIRAAADAGVIVFDSARAYAPVDDPFHNESLFAEALSGRPGILIGTKGGHFRTGQREWAIDNSPDRLRRDVDDSLVALGVEHIGLYYLHRADQPEPIARSVATLNELRQAGKIARIGISNVTAGQVDEAVTVAPIAAVQNHHSVGGSESIAVLRRCEELGIPFFAYSPLRGNGIGERAVRDFPRTSAIATSRGVSLQRLLLRAMLASSPMMSVIVGAGREETAVDSALAPFEPWDAELATLFALDVESGLT